MNFAHPLSTTAEFGYIIRRHPEVVRRMIRRGRIEKAGRPSLIHIREAEKFGLTLEEAHRLLVEFRIHKDAPTATLHHAA